MGLLQCLQPENSFYILVQHFAESLSSEHSYQFIQGNYNLAVTFINVYSKLCDERVCEGELRQSVRGNGELTDTHKTDPKLGEGKDSEGELADGDYPFGRNRSAFGRYLKEM